MQADRKTLHKLLVSTNAPRLSQTMSVAPRLRTAVNLLNGVRLPASPPMRRITTSPCLPWPSPRCCLVHCTTDASSPITRSTLSLALMRMERVSISSSEDSSVSCTHMQRITDLYLCCCLPSGFVCGYDAIGSHEKQQYTALGSGSSLIMSLLDNQVG